ncbi:MAG: EAL domain-containing protein, partial [Pseudomonadota bacterium]
WSDRSIRAGTGAGVGGKKPPMLGFLKKSIQRKFLAIMLGTLVAVNGPLLAALFWISSDAIEREMQIKKSAILAVNSTALSKPLWDFDFANLHEWAKTIVLNPGVVRVEIRDDSDSIVAEAEVPSSSEKIDTDKIYVSERDIFRSVDGRDVRVGKLSITYQRSQIGREAWDEVGKSALLFIVSTIAVLLAAIFANRVMIVAPLSRLTWTIDASRRDGMRHRIDWRSSDEIGRVANTFNEMQDRLDADEEQLRSAHKQVSALYNNTPSMLYSVDRGDVIRAVSDYWLRATGYTPQEVIGRQFSDFLSESSLNSYRTRRPATCMESGEVGETTCTFVKKDGATIDIMIREVADAEGAVSGSYSLSVMTDISGLKAAEAAIRRQAQTDPLTGLLNRAGFMDRLVSRIEECDQTGQSVAVLFFDLDRFKWVNDNLGHSAGDHVLETVTKRVRALLDETTSFGRFGGDEFSVLVSGPDSETRAIDLAGAINKVLCNPFELDGRRLSLSASIGISYYPSHAENADDLLRTSDVAMYQRKREGRNGFCLFNSQLGKQAGRFLDVEQAIVDGLANDWFDLHFQPIVHLKTGRTIGFEGLLRLNHPDEGLIPPDEVITTAEQNGSILEIGDRVIDLGLRQLERLSQDPELRDAYVAINLSAAQFLPGLPAKLAAKLMASTVDPSRLVLEITETVLLQQAPGLKDLFDAIRTLGCTFALDDFGTGYSSLSYLNRFPVDIIKIDQSFVAAMANDEENGSADKTNSLVEGIVVLAKKLNLQIVAEGVESADQARRLSAMGVDAGQGFGIGRPLPADSYLTHAVPKKNRATS